MKQFKVEQQEDNIPVLNKKKLCNKHGFYKDSDSCPKCKQESNKDYDNNLRAKDRKKIYNSKQWKSVRLKAMVRDNFLCVECKKLGIDTEGEEVDHIIELSDDITKAFDLDNLQYLCYKHHAEKTQIEREKRNNR